jgi:hypothetical protein
MRRALLSMLAVALWAASVLLHQAGPTEASEPAQVNQHGERMMIYHRAMDASVPAGAAIFLGDSITQGLATAAVAPYAVNYGIGSATTSELLGNLPAYRSLDRAGVVFLLVGINDIGRGQTAGLEDRLRQISAAIPSDRPLVWSGIMPAYVERADAVAILEANSAIREICASRPGCVYVDTHAALADPALFVDGVHPNAAGYAIWIEALRAAYKRANQQQQRAEARPEV